MNRNPYFPLSIEEVWKIKPWEEGFHHSINKSGDVFPPFGLSSNIVDSLNKKNNSQVSLSQIYYFFNDLLNFSQEFSEIIVYPPTEDNFKKVIINLSESKNEKHGFLLKTLASMYPQIVFEILNEEERIEKISTMESFKWVSKWVKKEEKRIQNKIEFSPEKEIQKKDSPEESKEGFKLEKEHLPTGKLTEEEELKSLDYAPALDLLHKKFVAEIKEVCALMLDFEKTTSHKFEFNGKLPVFQVKMTSLIRKEAERVGLNYQDPLFHVDYLWPLAVDLNKEEFRMFLKGAGSEGKKLLLNVGHHEKLLTGTRAAQFWIKFNHILEKTNEGTKWSTHLVDWLKDSFTEARWTQDVYFELGKDMLNFAFNLNELKTKVVLWQSLGGKIDAVIKSKNTDNLFDDSGDVCFSNIVNQRYQELKKLENKNNQSAQI